MEITKEMLEGALNAGIVKLLVNPQIESGTVCQIGEHWFYFGGALADELNPGAYAEAVATDAIVTQILDAVNLALDDAERGYYEAVISEWWSADAVLKATPLDALMDEFIRRGGPIWFLLEKAGYIAWKLWSEKDVENELERLNYSSCEENVAEVLNTGRLRALSECTDTDWDIIDSAIMECRDKLVPAEADEEEDDEDD